MVRIALALALTLAATTARAAQCDTGDADARLTCWTAVRTTAQEGYAAAQTEDARRSFRNTVMLANQRLGSLVIFKYSNDPAFARWQATKP